MKDRMERLVVLPFAVGCVSSSSIAVYEQGTRSRPAIAKHDTNTISLSPARDIKEQTKDTSLSSENMRSSFRFLSTLPKPPNISIGFQKLSKSLMKNFSHFFVLKEEMQEVEMEIGFPTDVKHVTHIGLDMSETTTTPGDGGGGSEKNASEFLSLGSTSLSQFELAISAQTDHLHLIY